MNTNCFGNTAREIPHPFFVSSLLSFPALFLSACFLSSSSSQAVNKAMEKQHQEYNIGVLDIYGFEIFQVNLQPKILHSWLPAR